MTEGSEQHSEPSVCMLFNRSTIPVALQRRGPESNRRMGVLQFSSALCRALEAFRRVSGASR
jgi:hypothetical protein